MDDSYKELCNRAVQAFSDAKADKERIFIVNGKSYKVNSNFNPPKVEEITTKTIDKTIHKR